MQPDIKYRFYPSILNEFQKFIREDGYEDKDGNFCPYVTFESLINSINRVSKPRTPAMQQGIDFENDVMVMVEWGTFSWRHEFDKFSANKFQNGYQVNESYFEVLKEVTKRLPSHFVAQKFVQRQHKDILFYGMIDVAGAGQIIDLKFSGNYSFPQFKDSYQNLYLWAIQDNGFRSMEYIISNLRQVYVEYYGLDYDFAGLLEGMEYFKDFLEQNRSLITDKKIIV